MRLKLLVLLSEKILGASAKDDAPRADMCLNERVLSLGLVLPVAGIAMGIAYVFTQNLALLIMAPLCIILGIGALMSWKNQTIRIVSDEEFDYTTMFGKTHRYAFADITGLKKNQDSMTLFVGQNKVHIESNAIMTKQLVDKINEALKNASKK